MSKFIANQPPSPRVTLLDIERLEGKWRLHESVCLMLLVAIHFPCFWFLTRGQTRAHGERVDGRRHDFLSPTRDASSPFLQTFFGRRTRIGWRASTGRSISFSGFHKPFSWNLRCRKGRCLNLTTAETRVRRWLQWWWWWGRRRWWWNGSVDLRWVWTSMSVCVCVRSCLHLLQMFMWERRGRVLACVRACVRVCGVSASKCLSSPPGLLFVVRKQAWMSVPPLVAIG